ncbi:MAG: tyrosine--tRNA ligase [Armatimonadota bacterium]|nr:tyrosine--tRNA ligase [Armatimonadota bacterium]
MRKSVDEQFEIIKLGAVEIVPEDELKRKLAKSERENRPLRIKLGIDPTAPDIHLGFAVPLRKMRQLQDLGHEVVLIVGDFTASIGDPSGKSETRPMLSAEQIRANAETFTAQFWIILDRSKTTLTFNGDWLGKMTFGDVVTETSRVTVARILERDDFQKRLAEERPIGLHELMYPIAQALDSVEVRADVEIGGTDQKFNILMGRDLQESHGQEAQVGLFMPLLPGLDGVQKMSKSLGNYIGITESPKDMFGKAMSIPDEVMPAYFELAAGMQATEVETIVRGIESGQIHPMDAKKRLASEITRIYHGEEAAQSAREEFERVFSQREIPTEMPEVSIPSDQFRDGRIWIVRLLTAAEMAKSNGEARRLVEQGGVTIDGERISDVNAEMEIRDGQILRAGKLRFARLRISG